MPVGGGGAPSASGGTPPRGASVDARLADMPEDLTEDQISNYIKEKCKLDDPMWNFVNAITKKSANVRWSCKVCDKTYTGGPQKIRAHFLSSLVGCSTCDGAGELREKANEAAQKHLDEEVRKREEKDALKKRKQQVVDAERASKARKVQGRIDRSEAEYSRAHLDGLWAKACYAAPFSFRLLENEFVREAVEATSLFHLPESSRADTENLPVYTLPKRGRLSGAMLASTKEESDRQLRDVQKTEALKYGCSATSDGWSSNPQHRPVEAQLFETPTVTHMNHAEDLSGLQKTNFNVAKKLAQWADEGCEAMDNPKETVDFMCVDGAEIGAVNLLMAGAREGSDIITARPWLSGGVCTPHSLDLELEDIAKLQWIATHLAEAKRMVKFIREHHYSLWLWRETAEYELLNPNDTRFATNFIMHGSLHKQREAAGEFSADRRYMQWLTGTLPGKRQGSIARPPGPCCIIARDGRARSTNLCVAIV